jgi:hypothetical protein
VGANEIPTHVLEQEDFETKVSFLCDLLDIESEQVMEAPLWAWHLAEKLVWSGWKKND